MNELSLYAPVRYELMLMLWIEENAGGALSPWFCIGEILPVVCMYNMHVHVYAWKAMQLKYV